MTNNDIKKIATSEEAQKIISKITNEVCDIITSTLGPAGRTALIERGYRYPESTDDGFSVAEQIVLADELEGLVCQAVIQATKKVNETVGDGTTSAAELTKAIYNTGLKLISSGNGIAKIRGMESLNAVQVCKQIEEACAKAVELLKGQSKMIETKEDIINIATISVKNPQEGQKIGEMAHELGPEMFIDVLEDTIWETQYELIKGMRFPCKIGSQAFITNTKNECYLQNYNVFFTTHELNDIKAVNDIISVWDKRSAEDRGAGIAFLAARFSKEVLDFLIRTDNAAYLQEKAKPGLKLARFVALCIPALTNNQVDDAALYCGCEQKDIMKGQMLNNFEVSNLGTVKKLIATGDSLILIDGAGDSEVIKNKITELKELKQNEKKGYNTEMVIKDYSVRISNLTAGIGRIRAGGKTDSERLRKFKKYQDAVGACRSAYEEGYVQGGGLALCKVADELGDTIITEALRSPHNKILENIGDPNFKIEDGVIDPTKAVRVALESACSAACSLLMTDTLIAFKRDKLEDLRTVINNTVK